ncbi:TIGR03086 family protein [Mangrovihabitans endophyticus]|uniref:TIGR03086 family protein n=1 Tax=Mangrovihabitans endophyticus TaxID=1751298 RepID=A0A8J3C182_9ACTN|nr:TIGR03086 family protein [Mangrovihabitans endophyticus]
MLLGITDDALTGPTPCAQWSVGDLLDHIVRLSLEFTQAARKLGEARPPEQPSAASLPRHWRSRLPVLLEELAVAWRDPDAWTGTAAAGGVTLPAAEMGRVAMTEVIMHSWDLARATGQEFIADPRVLEALAEFLSQAALTDAPGLFGPRVAVSEDAPLLDQVLGLAGRDPRWHPGHPGVSARSSSAAS